MVEILAIGDERQGAGGGRGFDMHGLVEGGHGGEKCGMGVSNGVVVGDDKHVGRNGQGGRGPEEQGEGQEEEKGGGVAHVGEVGRGRGQG